MPGRIITEVGYGRFINDLDVLQESRVSIGILPDADPSVHEFPTISFSSLLATSGPSENPSEFTIATSYTYDVLHKWYLVPFNLNLSNPRLNTDIPFFIWNTFGRPQSISILEIIGTESLEFDIGPGTLFTVGEYKQANVRILPGDPAIDAIMQFTTEDGFARLGIIASLADTFNLIPEIPVREIWTYKTEVYTSYNGTEQRHSFIANPRISLSFTTLIADEKERKSNFNLLYNNIQFESLVPFYQYATNPTQTSEVGSSRIYLDMKRSNFRVDVFAILVEPRSLSLIIARVAEVLEDSIIISTSITEEVTDKWVVSPGITSLISAGSGFTMSGVSGVIKIDSESFEEPDVVRPNAVRQVDSFLGIVHVNRRPLQTAQEGFSYDREVIDNEVGVRIVKSAFPHPVIEGTRSFEIQRVLDPDEMDYWRDFADKTRGNFKPFLLSTWLEDLTPAATIESSVTTIEIQEGFYASSYFPFDTFKRIQIEYSDGSFSYHFVNTASETPSGTVQLSIIPETPIINPGVFVKKISYLLKFTGSDVVTFEHGATTTKVTIQVRTTDF